MPEAAVARLVGEAGERIASEAIDRLAPLEIAAVDGEVIRLSRGGQELVPGARLRVLAAGSVADDPRTVAIVEIRSSSGPSPVAAVLEGDASKVTVGLRLKPIASR